MLSLLAISLLERFSSNESRTSCSRRLRLVTVSVLRRRPWPVRIESTNPDTTDRDQRQSAHELLASFHVGQQTLHTKTQQRIAVGVAELFADNDQASLRITLQNVGQQRAGRGTGGMRIDDINLRLRRFQIAKIGSKCGFKVLRGDLELRLGEQTLELAQHQRVRREDADRQFCGSAFRSHCTVNVEERVSTGQGAFGQVLSYCYVTLGVLFQAGDSTKR